MSVSFDWPAFLPAFSAAALRMGFCGTSLLETEDGPLMAWEKTGSGSLCYVSAGIHGDEPAGPLALLRMMEEGFYNDGRSWLLCPALNCGGLALGTRENRAGMDLNRDYRVFASPEIAAHAAWLGGQQVPDIFVSLHEDWETSGFYFYEINLGEDMPQRASMLLEAVKPHFPSEPGPEIDGHVVRADGWIHHRAEADLPDSWPEAIFLAKRGCQLSFTFETPSRADLGKRVAAHMAAMASLFAKGSIIA